MPYKWNECNILTTCQLVGLVAVFHPKQFYVFFLLTNKPVLFERKSRHPTPPTLSCPSELASLVTRTFSHVPQRSRACLPARLPPGLRSSVTSSSLSPNLHLPVATKPEALPKRFWSDSSTKQEAPHFQFITLFTGYIIPPQKSLSAW